MTAHVIPPGLLGVPASEVADVLRLAEVRHDQITGTDDRANDARRLYGGIFFTAQWLVGELDESPLSAEGSGPYPRTRRNLEGLLATAGLAAHGQSGREVDTAYARGVQLAVQYALGLPSGRRILDLLDVGRRAA